MEHLNTHTTDGAQLNLDALYKICPSCFTETKDENGELRKVVDFAKLRALLGDNTNDGAPESYDFTWVGKRAAQREAAAPISKTLRPCPEESVDWENTKNLYIEGDNLEVLKLLQNSYMGKVKMIYIDPPYNTGNDFVYHDDFSVSADEYEGASGNVNEAGERFRKNTDSNGRFHSDWCSMMYARLLVARSLLREDGVIFISIDDNEVENLKKICNEVFSETNYLNTFAWVSNLTGRQISGSGAAKTWETVLVYCKNIELSYSLNVTISFAKNKMPDAYKGFNRDIRKDAYGEYSIGDTLYNHNRKFNEQTRKNLVFSIFYNPNTEEFIPGEIGEKKEGFIEIMPHANGDGIHKYHAWRWSKEKISKESYNLIALPTSKGGYEIYTRIRDFNTTLLKDIITNVSNGDAEVQKLFDNKKYFDYPKSVDLLRSFIGSINTKDFIALDFFSGSGTTAHAVLQQNLEDGGNRKFMMVQLPELTDKDSEAYKAGYKNICEIGKERIRRAGAKIKAENPNVDTGFRVFKCDESNYKDVYLNPSAYQQEELDLFLDNIKDGRTDLDLLFDCMLRWGVELSLPMTQTKADGCTIHNVNDGDLVACFDGVITDKVIDAIAEMNPLRIVFRDSSFEEASEKMNLYELFKQKCGWSEQEVKNNVRVI